MRSIHRTLALSLTLALGPAFLPLGCGGALGPANSAQGDAEVPEHVALQLRACAAEHMEHLERRAHFVIFDVKLANNGEVDEVALRRSTLGDDPLEICMASALRELSEDDLLLRRADSRPAGPVAPEARALLGHAVPLPAACVANAPLCLLVLGVVIGITAIVVHVYVQPSTQPGPVTHHHHHPPAATAPPMVSAAPLPTATAPPMPTTLTAGDADLWRRCQQQHETYKKTQDEAADLARQTDTIEDLLHNNKASASQRSEFCSALEKRINLKKQEHEERSKYMKLDCDKFDWFNTGTTKAQRLADHQEEAKNVDAHVKNLYATRKRFCQ